MKYPDVIRLVSACLGLGVLGAATVRAQSFSYSDFSGPNLLANPLQINGSASAPVNNGTTDVLRLTPALGGQAGSAFSLHTVQLGSNASFSTAFSFQISNGGGIIDPANNPAGADGLVFVLNTLSNSVGTSGQGVGYQGIGHSVGIKYDTWQDGDINGFYNDNDPNGNFVAVYTDGSTHLHDPIYTAYNGPGDATTYYTPGTLLKNGDIWYSWIDYNGVTNQLDVRLSDGVDVRPLNPQLSVNVNLNDSTILGSAPNVYAGFTSGTGGAWDNHDILSWGFNDTYNPISTVGGSVPDTASTLGLLGLSFGALAAAARVRRRRSTAA